MNKLFIICIISLAGLLPGNFVYATEQENPCLENEISILRDSIKMLRYPAAERTAYIKKLIRKNQPEEAIKQIDELQKLFPLSAEVHNINKLQKKAEKKKKQQDRLKAQGVKAFLNTTSGHIENLTYAFTPLYFSNVYYYDYCESIENSTYETLEKDKTFLLSTLTLETKDKEAILPIIGAYIVENGILKRIATFRYEYAWWLTYDAMINGLYQSYHDFAYVDLIRYEIAAEIDAVTAKQPIVVLMNKTGRTIKWEMTPEEAEKECIIIKVMNRHKL